MAKIANQDVIHGGQAKINPIVGRVRITKVEVKDTAPKPDKNRPAYPMTIMTCEVIEPEIADVSGQKVSLIGRQVRINALHLASESWGHAKFLEFAAKIGLTIPEDGWDPEAQKDELVGFEFDYLLETPEEDVKRLPKKIGQKLGDPILGRDNQPLSNGWPLKGELTNVPTNCSPTKVEQPAW